MASKHPLKTVLWIDASQVRRVLMNELFKTAGIEAFSFSDPSELSAEVLKSLDPTLLIVHSDFIDSLSEEAFSPYKPSVIILGAESEAYKYLPLPIKPLEIVDELLELL